MAVNISGATLKSYSSYLAERAASSTGVSMVPGLNGAGDAVQDVSAFLFKRGNQTAVAASKIKIEKLIEDSASFPMENEGAIWTGTTYAFAAFSKTFDSTYTTTPDASPTGALWAVANNDGAPGDVVAFMADCIVRQAGGVGFGANIIARDDGVNAKLVGLEIDLQFSATGSVAAGSGGLYINVSNKTSAGPAIQLSGIGGGKFTNGIVLDAIVGAGLTPNGVASMASLINTASGVYSDAAIILGNTHKIKLNGTATTHGYFYNDATDALRIVLGDASTLAIRDNADANTLFTFAAGGVLTLAAPNATTEYRFNGTKVVGARDTGWVAMTGTPNENTSYATGTVTLAQLAGRVMAIQTALTTHGLIGT